jgi:transcriptional regulator with XRE-family HTH domain
MTDTTTDLGAATAGMVADLTDFYRQLVKYSLPGVRAAWRFGQRIDSYTDDWTVKEIAELMGLSSGTISRYLRFYGAFQRPELATDAAVALGTFNIYLLWRWAVYGVEPEQGRAPSGRHYRYTCRHCGGHEVGREEIDEEGELVGDPVELISAAVPAARFEAGVSA